SPPGRSVLVGDPVVFTYQVTNAGNVALTTVTVSDDQEGFVCTIPAIGVGETATACTKNAVAKKGQYTNTGTAATSYPVVAANGQPESVPVSGSNVDHYF